MKPALLRGLLLAFCAITAAFSVASILDITGAGGAAPWYGLWGNVYGVSLQPYRLEFSGLREG